MNNNNILTNNGSNGHNDVTILLLTSGEVEVLEIEISRWQIHKGLLHRAS